MLLHFFFSFNFNPEGIFFLFCERNKSILSIGNDCGKLYVWKPWKDKPEFYFPLLPYIGIEDKFANLRNTLLLFIANYTIQTYPGLWFDSLWSLNDP